MPQQWSEEGEEEAFDGGDNEDTSVWCPCLSSCHTYREHLHKADQNWIKAWMARTFQVQNLHQTGLPDEWFYNIIICVSSGSPFFFIVLFKQECCCPQQGDHQVYKLSFPITTGPTRSYLFFWGEYYYEHGCFVCWCFFLSPAIIPPWEPQSEQWL